MWKRVHVYYYDDAKENLVLDGIRPALQALEQMPGVSGSYLRRHWKFGPHIALYLEVESEEVFSSQVWPYLQETLGAYLQDHPSRQELDPVQYLERSVTLGAWELEPGPYEPLQPDNSMSLHPYGQLAGVLKGEHVLQTMEWFWKKSTGLMLDLLDATRGDLPSRQLYLIKLMAAVAHLYPVDGIVRGQLSYRSHAEAYFVSFDQDGRLQKMFSTQDQQVAPFVDEAVLSVLNETDEDGVYGGPDPLLRQWSQLMKELYETCLEQARQGRLTSDTSHYSELAEEIGESARERWIGEWDEAKQSEFHKELNEVISDQFFSSPQFSSYRMLVNSFYTYLPLMGINPNMKHLLCYLISRSVERIAGVDWKGIFYKQGPKGRNGWKGGRPSHEAEK
ncbi:hypothetical protein JJB07_09905 [Tumebacillus sp. ITR2]|uniref:Thiopeptide-type bacteriocin biosynthesis domain-containing protein n=1 Tax=Tumebacillus amylolyticus TaxID=2801339 RepID=A0ABS1JBH4_9BACL|nr:lantibiotic dehydratase C-terminal domain-containing protein [Tumebacillus amylolyticus]MBL0386968.1 hypothetical protein [Tumebacillus amylolyticus]